MQYDQIFIEIQRPNLTDRYRLSEINFMNRYEGEDGTPVVRFTINGWEDGEYEELPWLEGGEMLWGMVKDTTIVLEAVEVDDDADSN